MTAPPTGDAAWTLVGSVGGAGVCAVDPAGMLLAPTWALDWWVGADDAWHHPRDEPSTRQRLLTPGVVETRVKVPGGGAVQRVYGVGGKGDVVAVEFENDSPAPFSVALAGDSPAWVSAREPFTDLPVEASGGPPDGASHLPVAHRATVRIGIATDLTTEPDIDLAALPSAEAVGRGWETHLAHAMRVETGDERFDGAVRAACASLLLFDDGVAVHPAPLGHAPSDPADEVAVLAAREAWGLGRHAAELWPSIKRRHRRRRPEPLGPGQALTTVDAMLASASPTIAWGREGEGHHGAEVARFLLAARDMLVGGTASSAALLPALPPAWEKAPIEVHAAPLGEGTLSFALRWHGEKPALLWEADGATPTLTAPALAPGWSSSEPRGEELLV